MLFQPGPQCEICFFVFFNPACRAVPGTERQGGGSDCETRRQTSTPVTERPGKRPALEQLNCPEKVRRGHQTTG
jgi:hypothetical protein